MPNLRKKWYDKGIRELTEAERYILTLVERKVEDAKELGIGDEIMDDYVKESIPIETISKCTGLTVEEINRLQENL